VTTALVIVDGLADEPGPDGSTPLQAAHTPVLDRLAGQGTVGRWQPTPSGYLPGSEVGLLSCLGMTPPKVGRAGFEALGRRIPLQSDDVAYRVSPVRLSGSVERLDSVFLDVAPKAPAHDVLLALATWLRGQGNIRLFPSRSGRHIMVVPGGSVVTTAGPHQLSGLPLEAGGRLPDGVPWAAIQERLGGMALWPWGGAGKLPPMAKRDGVLIAAVPLVKGIGHWLGYTVPNVPGVTGDVDTDLAAKATAAISAIKAGERVVVHVEGPDMAAHRRDPAAKQTAISAIDRELISPLADAVDRLNGRLMVTCDHGTSSLSGRHLDDPVPYLLHGVAMDEHDFSETGDAPVLDAAAWQRLLVEAPVGC
jgi:2,3-bisphosphoglycerate-independent phosphoglycerate mutase